MNEVVEKHYRDKSKEFFTGFAIEFPKICGNVGTAFRTCTSLGVADFLATVGERYHMPHSDTINAAKRVPTFNPKSFQELVALTPLTCNLVGVELDPRAEPIETFDWPARCLLLFGSEDQGLSQQARKSCRWIIKLPAPDGFGMNLSASVAIVAWERLRWLQRQGFKK